MAWSTGALIGMLVVETVAKIRQGYFVQGKAIKAISVAKLPLAKDIDEFTFGDTPFNQALGA